MTESFRWTNCYADVVSSKYGPMTHAFLLDVVEPALVALDSQISGLEKSGEPGAPFMQADTEELLRATTMAFCLSIQSLWERQIRAYLQGCAKELRSDGALARRAVHGRWEEIDSVFNELRGISLTEFEEYPQLDLLHLLGNACRHGDGPSVGMLWKTHPELWPCRQVMHLPFSVDATSLTPRLPSIDGVVIPRDLLRSFVRAIASFWEETEYIYLESIERKHASLEAKLIETRRERADRGRK